MSDSSVQTIPSSTSLFNRPCPLWLKLAGCGFAIVGVLGAGYRVYQSKKKYQPPSTPQGPQKEETTPLLVLAKQLSDQMIKEEQQHTKEQESVPTIEL